MLGTSSTHSRFGGLSSHPLHIVFLLPEDLYTGHIGWRADGWVDYGQAMMPKSDRLRAKRPILAHWLSPA
jgi:hypothetical protein